MANVKLNGFASVCSLLIAVVSCATAAFGNTSPYPYKGGEVPNKAGCATVDPDHTNLCNQWFDAPATPAGSNTNVNANTNTLAPSTNSNAKAQAEAWAKANANATAKQKLEFAANLANKNQIDLQTANTLTNNAFGGVANATVTQGSNSLNNNNVTFGSVAPAALNIPGGTCVASVTYPSGLKTELASPMASRSTAIGGTVGLGNGYTNVGGSYSSARAEGINAKDCGILQRNVVNVETRAVKALDFVSDQDLILGRPVQVSSPTINNVQNQGQQPGQPAPQQGVQRGRQY